jgi:hypothetical protein
MEKAARQNSLEAGASRCDARTARRAVPTKANKDLCRAPDGELVIEFVIGN